MNECTDPVDCAIGGVGGFIDSVGGAVNYWSDPWGNTFAALRDASKSLATELLPALTTATLPDLSADWFIAAYRIAFAAALFVAVVLLIPQVIRTARGAQSGRELASSMGLFFPLFLLGAMFGPAAGLLLVRFFHALSTDLGVWGITGSTERVTAAFTTMLDEADPVGIAGGVPIAVLFMLLMLLGLVLVLCILVVQLVTLYFTGVLVPLGLVWVIDARRRTFGLRLIGLWFGILAAHPVLFFMLGFAFTLMGSSVDTFGNNLGLRTLVQLLVAVAAMFIAGLSPLLLMKFAPILPVGTGGTAGAAVNVPNWGPRSTGEATERQRPAAYDGGAQPQSQPQAVQTVEGDGDGVDDTAPVSGGLGDQAAARAGGTTGTVPTAVAGTAAATGETAAATSGATGTVAAATTAETAAGAAAVTGVAETASGGGAVIGVPTLVVAGTTYVAVKTAQSAQKAGELAQEAGMQATLAMEDEGEQS